MEDCVLGCGNRHPEERLLVECDRFLGGDYEIKL